MTGIAWKSWESHSLHATMSDQSFGEYLRARLCLSESERQCPQPAKREIGLHGTRHGPE